jgi:predicted acylesterase/phospholipase RssA
MRDGSLARAMRATMSMPVLFPPEILGDQVLVDGGTLNQIPTDVARAMGAAIVIAVNVGELVKQSPIDYSLLGLVAESMDAMIRANAAVNLAAADGTFGVRGWMAGIGHRVRPRRGCRDRGPGERRRDRGFVTRTNFRRHQSRRER